MKSKNVFLQSIGLGALFTVLFLGCQDDAERQIKLAPKPLGAIKQDEVKTIQLAVAEKKIICCSSGKISVYFATAYSSGISWAKALSMKFIFTFKENKTSIGCQKRSLLPDP